MTDEQVARTKRGGALEYQDGTQGGEIRCEPWSVQLSFVTVNPRSDGKRVRTRKLFGSRREVRILHSTQLSQSRREQFGRFGQASRMGIAIELVQKVGKRWVEWLP